MSSVKQTTFRPMRRATSGITFTTIHQIFQQAGDDDYLALACIHQLKGKQYDQELRDYCTRRIGHRSPFDKEFHEALASFAGRNQPTTVPTARP
jgi:hypothetical protein